MNKLYVSYEEGSQGAFTEYEMNQLYNEQVNKSEYETFEDWKYDMLRSGVFEKLQ